MDLISLWETASKTQELITGFKSSNVMIVFNAFSPLYTPKPVTPRLINVLRCNHKVLRSKFCRVIQRNNSLMLKWKAVLHNDSRKFKIGSARQTE